MISGENSNSFLLTLFGFEKARSKAHVLLIILIHAAGWCLFFFLPVLLYPVRINDSQFVIRELIAKSILVVLFYLNYYFLIPRFFERKKYFAYFSLIILLFVIYMVQYVMVRTSLFSRRGGRFPFVEFKAHPPNKDSLITDSAFINARQKIIAGFADSIPDPLSFNTALKQRDRSQKFRPPLTIGESTLFGIPKGIWIMTLNNAVSSFVLLLLIGGFIRLAYSFIRNQNEKKLLENANLNAEVNFLRSQINPHFLFNTLNSIYSQAHARSANTEFSILRLSELLRYVLYDSGDDKVELSKDIQYINNYIDLQRLRLSKKVSIIYSVTGQIEGKLIAPLLLISFIENAFKHGISYTQPSTIEISIVIFEKTLTLSVVNPLTETNSFAPGGLGLKNVRRRLELLYADHHELDIQRNDSLHIVNLKLELANA